MVPLKKSQKSKVEMKYMEISSEIKIMSFVFHLSNGICTFNPPGKGGTSI